MKRLPIIVLALLFAGFVTSSASSQFVNSCGDDAPSGLILYSAYDESGKAASPPLALLNPLTGVTRPVDLQDPREVVAHSGSCIGRVTSLTGEVWAVNGVNGEVVLLADPTEPGITFRAGAGYFALLTPGGGEAWSKSRILDIRSGNVQSIFRDDRSDNSLFWMSFSPKGNNLFLLGIGDNAVLSLRYGGQAQTLAGNGIPTEHGFDEAEDRMLVVASRSDGTQDLYLQDLRTATAKKLASAQLEGIGRQYIDSSFVPGYTDTISVLFPDHFAIMDVSGDMPREVKSIDGSFGKVWLDPDLGGVLLEERAPTDDSLSKEDGGEQELGLTYVNFSDGKVTPIDAEFGSPIAFWGSVSESSVLLYSQSGTRVQALTSFNLSTGETHAFPIASQESVEISTLRTAQEGEFVLVVAGIKDNRQRISLFNAKTGEVNLLAEAGRVSGSVSPDGKWVVFTTLEKTDAGRVITMTLMNMVTGEMSPLEPGLNPTWLN